MKINLKKHNIKKRFTKNIIKEKTYSRAKRDKSNNCKNNILSTKNYLNNLKFDINKTFKNTFIKKKRENNFEKSDNLNSYLINELNFISKDISYNKSTNRIINKRVKKLSIIKNEFLNQKEILNYRIIKDIGIGSFSITYLVKDMKDKKIYALKELKNNNKENLKEIEILKLFDHPNIIKYYKHFEFQEKIYFLLEYGGDRSLNDYLKSKNNHRLEEDEAIIIFKQILNAVRYLHKKGYAHCDLKLDNVMINKDRNKIKLIDFGFCSKFKKTKDFIGTLFYMSYDILNNKLHFNYYDDIWALGIIWFKLIFSIFPFKGKNKFEISNKIKNKKDFYPKIIKISKELKILLNNILNIGKEKRFLIEDIYLSKWLN